MNKMSLQKSIQNFGIKQALKYMEKDPEENIPKLMDMVDKFAPDGWYEAQRNMIRKVIQERGNWYQLILRIYQLNPEVRKAFFQNFIFNASLKGSALQEQLAEENNCNIPWAILLDPTSACNLHCTGCWAAEYGHQLNLDLDTIDSIVRQGKELGTYMYIYTGGEPLVRKKDLIKICEMHPDCEFLSFTNGTLIDEEFCQEMLRVKEIFHRIRKFRQTKAIFSMDFQNDAQFVGGCIAGGRRYLHINAKGDVEPCVFIHYSNANIHDCSLLDALKSPLFQAYHDNQPFNDNMLRPCPMLENPDKLGEMVKESKAVNTDYQSPETPEHLKEKAAPYAENWTPTAEKLWNKEKEKIAAGKAGVEQ